MWFGQQGGGKTCCWLPRVNEVGFKNEDVSDFPAGPVVENPPANAGNMCSIPGLGKFYIPRGN